VTLTSAVEKESEYTVTLFENSDYGGEQMGISIYLDPEDGEYKLEWEYPGAKFWNKNGGKISSFETFEDDPAVWWIYDKTYCSGTALDEGSGPKDKLYGNNDKISSFRVECPSGSVKTHFNIYEHEDYNGQCLPFKLWKSPTSNGTVLEISGLDDHWNDYISSVKVSHYDTDKSYEWILFDDAHCQGQAIRIDKDKHDLGARNDKCSSIRFWFQ